MTINSATVAKVFHYLMAYASVALAAIPQDHLAPNARIALGIFGAVLRYVADPSTGTPPVTTMTTPTGATTTVVNTPKGAT